MVRLALAVFLFATLYIAAGEVVYLNDVHRHWCDVDFDWVSAGWMALIWPLRLLAGDAICD